MAAGARAKVTEPQLRECCAQLERRLRNGECGRAEEFLLAHPTLAEDAESALDLIYTEFIVRSECGPVPTAEEYYARFPQWGDLLFHQFQVHTLLCAGLPGQGAKADAAAKAGELARGTLWKANPENFEVLQVIARGSSGVVFNAWQKSPPRVVALKAFPSLQWATDDELARFRREAAAVARLTHPNIVQLYHVGEWEETPYLVFESVDGGTLAEKWAGVPQAATDVATIVLTLARAVDHAHQRGVVHRDLRPANILLTRGGEPKITDFGLAKLVLASGDDLTLKDQVLGTPGYMAPEQAEGRSKDAGAPADVYALGAMLYEGITGRPPFRGPTVLETLQQVSASAPTPPWRFQRGVSRDLESICLKCLQKDPARRYTRAADLADDLRRFLAGEPTQARPLRVPERVWRWCGRNRLAASLTFALTAVLMIACVLVSWKWRQEAAAHHTAKIARDAAIKAQADAEDERRRTDRISAGIMLDQALTQADHGNMALAMLLLGQCLEQASRLGDAGLERAARINLTACRAELVRRRAVLPHPDWASSGAYSPDGKLAVTVSKDRSARLWDTETGKLVGEPMQHPLPVWTAAFSPDGKVLLTGCGDPDKKTGTLRFWTVATGQPLGPPLSEDKAIARSVAFSPDGQTMLVLDVDKAQVWSRVTAMPVGAPLAHPGTLWTAALSADGKLAITGGDDGTARLWRVPGGEPVGEPLRHLPAKGTPPKLQPRVVAVAFSPDSRLVATAAQFPQLVDVKENKDGVVIDRKEWGWAGGEARVWDAITGKPLGPPLAHAGPVKTVAFSPDSQGIVTGGFVVDPKAKGTLRGEARMWDARSSRQMGAILHHEQPVWAVAFGANGRVVVTGGEEGITRFWLSATARNIASSWSHGNAKTIVVSPDGTNALVGHTYTTAVAEIWEVPPGWGSILRPIDSERIQTFLFSPDGKALVTTAGTGTARLWDWAAGEASGAMLHRGSPRTLAFTADSKQVLTALENDQLQWLSTGTREPVGPALKHRTAVSAALVSPDGKLLWTRDFDRHAYLWETATGRPIRAPVEVGVGNTAVAFRSRSTMAAVVQGQNVARWAMHTGQRKEPPLHHPAEVTALAFSPNGHWLATGCEDGTARIWDADSGKLHGRPLDHLSAVAGVAFSPNGKLLVVWGVKNNVQIWDVANGTPVSPLLPHRSEVTNAVFNPDSRSLAVASGATVIVWDVATGRRLGQPMVHPDLVTRLVYHPNGSVLATGCADGLLRLFEAPRPAVGDPELVRQWVEVLTGKALADTGNFVEIEPETRLHRRRALDSQGPEPFRLR
jgi:WD40 repeat protein